MQRKFVCLVTAVLIVCAMLFACSQSETSVPVQSFRRAQRMDTVCLQVIDDNGNRQTPAPRPPTDCAPVSPDVDGNNLQNQLFAVVTQSASGELAVVNLSAGVVVDQNRTNPGIDFIPVGMVPTDVATAPDGQMVFVAAAEVNKPAIYGVPSSRLLGDTPGYPPDPQGQADLRSWPVCALPQKPGALAIVSRTGATTNADAGEGTLDYEIVAALPGDRLNTTKIVTIDPRPFLRGANIAGAGEGSVLDPGALEPCPITSSISLVDASALPATFAPGPAWQNGVPYVDGGIDLTCERPLPAAVCGTTPCCTEPDPVGDGGVDAAAPVDAGTCIPLDEQDAGGPQPLSLGSLDSPRPVSIALVDQTLYVADDTVPFVHVIDLSTQGSPLELPPLVATSLAQPSRAVSLSDVTVSPPTHDYKRFLYAVDKADGSIVVFDVTDPKSTIRTPVTRPNPELNPFAPPDRIAFSSPVVAVAFARHDFPLSNINGVNLPNSRSGLICNANQNIDPNNPQDFGFYYRADRGEAPAALGPLRLRGIFAFAVLANGQVVVVDVDDWDAPCRRPATLDGGPPSAADLQGALASANLQGVLASVPGALAAAQIDSSTNKTDFAPYDAQTTDPGATSEEGFFPISAPHHIRSQYLIKNDSTSGNHLPSLQTVPNVGTNGIPLPQVGSGAGSEKTPALSLLFSYDVPDAHIANQDWFITFEGQLPGYDGINATISTTDDYQSLTLSAPHGQFCAKGVEDWDQGRMRAAAVNAAVQGDLVDSDLQWKIADYVQVSDDLLSNDDPYWATDQSCWDSSLVTPQQRFDSCNAAFGLASDQMVSRDFPILEAYDGKFVLGRFYYGDISPRRVVYKDPTNPPYLKQLQCCFHNQIAFHVRTGGQWSTVGNIVGGAVGLGFLHHMVTGSDGRCVPSCDPRLSLMNGRAPPVPPSCDPSRTDACLPAGTTISRDSQLAMRNPIFSVVMQNPSSGSLIERDTAYTFTTQQAFSPLLVDIGNTAGTINLVNPQSIQYIESLGQIAVVDGATQGLVLIDLDNVIIAHAPYF
ncbi:MAG: hypothetical protein FWD69_06730 [Polyangiaceae bacterium]|nr:hypothetical protein [Polyangiaceae bacterium]